jgi:hypothetical protein
VISPSLYGLLAILQAPPTEQTPVSGLQDLIVYLCGAAIVGLVVAVITLWREFAAHRLHVAEVYMNSHDVDEMKRDLRELRDVVFKIAVKMDVPTFTETFRR